MEPLGSKRKYRYGLLVLVAIEVGGWGKFGWGDRAFHG